ncbi:MAG: CRISPR-associated endonuclease Cas2 [Candidatus Calescibacterium sp.]|nr:CRISPR-associated endonuclease Cas2 [Candidatus Calescibacterium sp.]
MYIVVAYDITDDRRRDRLAKRLKAYIDRVQKSVFEGEVSQDVLDRIRRIVIDTIDMQTDSVRIYHLCGKCRGYTELIGTALPWQERTDEII